MAALPLHSPCGFSPGSSSPDHCPPVGSAPLSHARKVSSFSIRAPPAQQKASIPSSTNQAWLDDALGQAQDMVDSGACITKEHAYRLLKECAKHPSLQSCRYIQSLMAHSGLDSAPFLADHLIRLFASIGSLDDAFQAFCKVAQPSVYTWSAIISPYAAVGNVEKAMELYDRMTLSGVEADTYIYLALLKTCTMASAMEQGKLIHEEIRHARLHSDLFVANALIDMYAKCGDLSEASRVFGEMPWRDVVSWSTMIAGYVYHGKCHLALDCFQQMQEAGIQPDRVVFVSILKACSGTGNLTQGSSIHKQIMQRQLEKDLSVCNTLVDMYAKCGDLNRAREVFDNMVQWDVVSWNAMIAGYSNHDDYPSAVNCFEKMQQEGIKPTKISFTTTLKACGSMKALEKGKLIHEQVMKCGLHMDAGVVNALVDMYAKCGDLKTAQTVFDTLVNRDVVSWGCIISAYAHNGEGSRALECLNKMQQEGVKPDAIIFVSLLKACGSLGDLTQGSLIHDQIVENGFESDQIVGNTLLDMYARCGCLDKARTVFDELANQNVVSWNAMISGYAQHGEGRLALDCFAKMQHEGIKPDNVTFLSILKACGSIGASVQGRIIHKQIMQSGLLPDPIIGNALVDMYAKAGSMQEALAVFDEMPEKNVASWGALIAGYAQCGNLESAIECFENMQAEGIKPDVMTFTSIFAACTRAGQVGEGQKYFRMMQEDYGMPPNMVHNNCMSDLLARSGDLDAAKDVIQPNLVALTSLLSACKKYSNIELGRQCFDQIVQLDPQDAAGYVLMSDIYSKSGMTDHAAEIDELRRQAGAWKKPAKAWIEISDRVHEFIVGDQSHPQSDNIHAILKRLNEQMKESGFKSSTHMAKEEENTLCGHAERQAIAFGILSSPVGASIRVTKNLRMCNDCHSTVKVISKIERREIIIKDTYCIHHMEDGICSCGDNG